MSSSADCGYVSKITEEKAAVVESEIEVKKSSGLFVQVWQDFHASRVVGRKLLLLRKLS